MYIINTGYKSTKTNFYINSNLYIYLQVNALSERIIRIYLHEFTNNERGRRVRYWKFRVHC